MYDGPRGENLKTLDRSHTRKPVIAINMSTGENLILDGSSFGEQYGFTRSGITACLSGKQKTPPIVITSFLIFLSVNHK